MNIQDFFNCIGKEFYTGVPDSQLRPLCDYLMNVYGIDKRHHIIAANEGNSCALATGYYLATGSIPVVYMQNSGEGNIINPVASLLSDEVYAIPVIFIIGWRGEPGVHDEPQHIYQGKVTLKLLEDMDIANCVIDKETTVNELEQIMIDFEEKLSMGKCVAFVVKKGALTYDEKVAYQNDNILFREDIIKHIVKIADKDPIISTTGKASRELYEIREANNQTHEYDFLTVGSMGHASSIAMGVAINKPAQKVWCIDGDGAALMHLGALAVIGVHNVNNLVHVVINNGAHETVGGMKTVAEKVNMIEIAKACGYKYAVSVNKIEALDVELRKAKSENVLTFIEVKSAIGSRTNLGRPTTEPVENKKNFMNYLQKI